MYYYIFLMTSATFKTQGGGEGGGINNTYIHYQPSQAHLLNLQNDVIISKWR